MIVHIGGIEVGEYIITSHLVPCSTLFHHVPPCSLWWISISALHWAICRSVSEKRWNQITQLVPGAHFLVARDVLARMWVYNRINIFIYCLFFVFVCLVVGSRNPMRIPDKSTNKTQNE